MTATLKTARNEIYDIFKAAWDANAGAVNGGVVPPIKREGISFTPPPGAAWAWLLIRHTGGTQATFSNSSGTGRRRFRKSGTISVRIYAPSSTSLDTTLAEDLAMVAEAAFEGKATPSDVWFRDVVPTEIGVNDPWIQFNVTASFEYDQFA